VFIVRWFWQPNSWRDVDLFRGKAAVTKEMITGRTPPSPALPPDPPLVAVVDDDESFLRSVGRLLRSAGYRVAMFSSAAECLASFPASQARCLILDVHMPRMTGLELLETLAARGACVPAIFVTAHDTPQTRERAHRAGSFGLLLKPFDKLALLSAIEEAIRCQSPDFISPLSSITPPRPSASL
jgi:CheY-like chemotaxis protein